MGIPHGSQEIRQLVSWHLLWNDKADYSDAWYGYGLCVPEPIMFWQPA